MSSFNDIRKRIQADIESGRDQNANPTAVAGKKVMAIDPTGRPQPASLTTGVVGTIVSKPGTEKVLMDASTFQFLECESAAQGASKKRYCIVEKGVKATYGNQYILSTGDVAHIVTRQVFNLMFSVISNAAKQIRQLTQDQQRAEQERDMYKMTIDALRKNGIID